MKELSIKEKAKRYDEAIELVNSKWHYKNQPCVIDVSEIFPELKESEDEKIRKRILFSLQKDIMATKNSGCNTKDLEECVAWLEKQGEQKPQGKSALEAAKEEKVDNQNCAKPADKVEPKFKQGEWITNNDYTWQIVNVTDLDYILQSQKGHIVYDTISYVDEQFHTFAIQDAKDGDVLVSESNCGLGTWYCIFKSLDDDESMTVYCYLTRDGRFETKKELCFDKSPFNTKPATKEHRDTLIKAMTDAGYTFDFDKKILNKIEQKPAWSEEDEAHIDSLLKRLEGINKPGAAFISTIFAISEDEDWLKSLKDRYTWKPSEEQMKALEHFVRSIGESGYASPYENNTKLLYSLLEQLKKL